MWLEYRAALSFIHTVRTFHRVLFSDEGKSLPESWATLGKKTPVLGDSWMARISRTVHMRPPSRQKNADMFAPRSGFSIIELTIVLMVGSILTSIAITSFNGVSGRYAVGGARQSFMSMHARARAQAIEYGQTVRLNVDPGDDSVWLSRGNEILELLDFGEVFNVDVRTSTDANLWVCMSPRGFADTGCNNFSSTVTVDFLLPSDTASVSILTLGQMRAD